MATEVKLPRLGQGMESGTIVKWLKGEGEPVKKREPLYELDTDKVTQEVEAEADGVLLKIVVDRGRGRGRQDDRLHRQEGEDVPRERRRAGGGRGGVGRGGGRGAGRGPDRGRFRAGHGRPARARPEAAAATAEAATAAVADAPVRAGRPRQGLAARAQDRAREGASTSRRFRQRPRRPDRRRGRRARRRRGAEGGPGSRRAPPRRRGRGDRADVDRKTIARRLTEAWQAPVFQLDGHGRHDPLARAARAARRAPPRGRDEADRQRPADEGVPRPRSSAIRR